MSEVEKDKALIAISGGQDFSSVGRSKFRVGNAVVHVRFCSENAKSPGKYKFNINPNTLSADYEMWICGSADTYYLMPVSLMREIYDNPNTYIDKAHPKIRVVSVDADSHWVTYATGGIGVSLSPYLSRSVT